jgi:GAF domain-containing protein/biotin carboxyl carrier protein
VGRVDSTTVAGTPTFGTNAVPAPAPDALHDATLEFFASDDAGEIAGKLLAAASHVVVADGTSIWIPVGDRLECRGAIGENRALLSGMSVAAPDITGAVDGEDDCAVATARLVVDGRVTAHVRVTRSLTRHGGFGESEHDALRRLTEAAGIAIASSTRLAASRQAASESARDLALITEMSREITSTLDLDRVLRSVVNLASRALTFDRGALALYEHGVCDIRAVAGADGVDAKDPALQDLAVRAAWAAGLGESFYLSERSDPGSDAERTFVQIFGVDLERDGAMSGFYLPLKDEEGIVGILLFEASCADFATERQRELAGILANQATVALRNARLYHQVPLADAIGAFSARKKAFFEIPQRRRMVYAAAGLTAIAALTLIRWPLRVAGTDPVFRPLTRADIRPTLSGVIDRVFVREGVAVERGAPIAHLRDDALRAQRDAALAAVAAAERTAAIAASHSDAAEERLQRLRADVLRRDVEVLDEQIQSSIVRSPVQGVVLTPRPEERVGSHADAGDVLAVVGRTDSLELEFGVDQRDVTRLRAGDEVRLRVAALPQHTFSGRVVSIAPLSNGTSSDVSFPVRAIVGNPDALLRPGMAAYARVLTEPASVLGRLGRDPARSLRLWWWRFWS